MKAHGLADLGAEALHLGVGVFAASLKKVDAGVCDVSPRFKPSRITLECPRFEGGE